MSISRKNIAVAGAGVMGLTCAFTLAEAGHSVSLSDPEGFPANNASFKAGGMLAPYAEIEHMPAEWLEPCFESIKFWEHLATTHDFEFAQRGSLIVAHPQDRHMLDRFAQHIPNPKRMDVQGVETLEPSLAGRFREGLYLADEAHLHPQKAMMALLSRIENKHAYAFDIKSAEYDFVIDCRGLAAQDSDLRGVKGELLVVHNPDFTLTRPVRLMHPRYALYIVPRAGNIFMIGATQIEAEGEALPSVKSAMELMSALTTLHPSFADSAILTITADMRPSYPDNLPRIRRTGNVISCNGLFRHGFLLSPVMAACVLALVEGREVPYISYFMEGAEHEGHRQRNAKGFHSAA